MKDNLLAMIAGLAIVAVFVLMAIVLQGAAPWSEATPQA